MSGSNTVYYDVFRASMLELSAYIASNLGSLTLDIPESQRLGPSFILGVSTLAPSDGTLTLDEVTSGQILTLITQYIAQRGQQAIPLTNVSVDYETNVAEVQSVLGAQTTWIDTQYTSTGQRIIKMIAVALTFMQYSIVRAAQESEMPTAVIDNSIYANTLHLGVRLYRRIPGSMDVQLFNNGDTSNPYTIPAYSQFVCASYNLFNREIITIPANTSSIVVTLYEGQVQNLNMTSNGSPYLSIKFGNSDYSISDIDTVVTVNNINWTRTVFNQYFNIGLWEYGPTDQVFEDNTTSDGNVKIKFGNNINGLIPTSGAVINIGYVTTNGQEGNVNLTGNSVSYAGSSNNISGIALTPIQNGTDEKTAADYKTLGPGLFAAKYRASARPDCAALARTYPGIIDAFFQGQQELWPTNLSFMMYQQATLLTSSTWTSDQQNNFISWYTNLGVANFVLLLQFATPVTLNITANVYCVNLANQTTIKNSLIATIQAMFVPKAGVLGYSIMVSDIEYALKNTNPQQIDYVDLLAPTADTIVTPSQYVTLGTVTFNMFTSQRNTLS